MSEKGFIKLYRGWQDNPVFDGNAERKLAWLWLLERACWNPARFNIRGKTVALKRGQLAVTIRQLADEWGWSKTSVERFVTRLKTETMIEVEAGQGKSIITICNYVKYQGGNDGAWDKDGTETGTKSGQSRDIKEEKKEKKEEKKEKKEEKKTEYAFSGRVIRLTPATFAQWEKSFPDLDLPAQLESRDAYLAEQEEPIRKKWFMTTAAVLGNRQQAASQAKRPQSAVFDGPC